MYTADLRNEISQGDVFDNFPVVDVKFKSLNDDPEVSVRRSRVVLLSNDCDYDNCPYIMVAEARLLTTVAVNHQNTVRNGLSRKTFYLNEKPGLFSESFADFRCIHRVEKKFISEGGSVSPRIASFSDEERLALQRSIAVFFGIVPTSP
jgi:hypothetical protein